ncbi:MAG: ABC transporter permease subunit [Oscillospiraceae bacterium]
MRKLLSANFTRLWKNKVFWLGMIFMFGIGIAVVGNQYWELRKFGLEPVLDSALRTYAIFIGVAAAVVCGLFLGTEYSDGTVRNKLIVGLTRSAIYFANLIVCTAAALLLCAAYFAAVCALGILLLGGFHGAAGGIFLQLGVGLAMVAATAALLTLIGMLCQSRAHASVLCILLILVLLFAATYLHSRLSEPEIYEGYAYMDDSDQRVEVAAEPNPQYLRGNARAVYAFLLDFLPTGQAVQITMRGGVANTWQATLYSLILVLASTLVGLMIFRKKDIK